MISAEDAVHTYQHDWCYKDPERINNGKPVTANLSYSPNNNAERMRIESPRPGIAANRDKIGPS